ncbi:MAG: ketopantoate reductase family protein [Mycobacteriales bacterium]
MRYVILGAGAIGGAIGGRLAQHGQAVVLVARGAHAAALTEGGLALRGPDGAVVLHPPVATTTAGVDFGPGDVAVLAVKSQDSRAALDALAAVAPPDLPVVCAQNGVANERLALRRFARVYAMCVILPATHLAPGLVEMAGNGILDIGCYPAGTDEVAVRIAADLTAAGLVSRADPSIMRHKYTKLLLNLGNSMEAACGPAARHSPLVEEARAEARACYAASGIDFASETEDRERRRQLYVDPAWSGAGSSWQSLARQSGSIEADYLNGEVVLLGRLAGVPTPVNLGLQRLANRLAREQQPPGSLSLAEATREVEAAGGSARPAS